MVIGLAFDDGESPVQLLCKNRSHHLVGERHPGQGDEAFGPVIDLLRESVGAADDEHQRLPAPGEPLPDPVRPFDGPVFLAALVQQDNGVAGGCLLEDQLPLLLLDLLLRKSDFRHL